MESVRKLGKECISDAGLSNHIEELIYNLSESSNDKYKEILYSVIIDYMNNIDEDLLICNLQEGKVGWKHDKYAKYIRDIEEIDEFVNNPIEIEEGVLECVCGSKRTISFQKQTRSADEGSTTFAQCVECGRKWKNNC